jgi:hypothetical protein
VTQYQNDLSELKRAHNKLDKQIKENGTTVFLRSNLRKSISEDKKDEGFKDKTKCEKSIADLDIERDRRVISNLKLPFEQELLSPRLLFNSPREEIFNSQLKFMKENRKMPEFMNSKREKEPSQQKLLKKS